MKVNDLLSHWEETAKGKLTEELVSIQLPVEDAARLNALADMFPRRSASDIVTDLLSAALNDIESSLPYIQGSAVVGLDEEGDPLYEDVGPTPRYLALTKKHLKHYLGSNQDAH